MRDDFLFENPAVDFKGFAAERNLHPVCRPIRIENRQQAEHALIAGHSDFDSFAVFEDLKFGNYRPFPENIKNRRNRPAGINKRRSIN